MRTTKPRHQAERDFCLVWGVKVELNKQKKKRKKWVKPQQKTPFFLFIINNDLEIEKLNYEVLVIIYVKPQTSLY